MTKINLGKIKISLFQQWTDLFSDDSWNRFDFISFNITNWDSEFYTIHFSLIGFRISIIILI